jgi:hypothetical protein
MTTFTFRVSNSLADRLSSARMRSWIAEFLRQPQPLPLDPGPGQDRISLTLPGESVHALAGFLRCSPSEALRRVALNALGPSPVVLAAQGELEPRNTSWRPSEAPPRSRPQPESRELTPALEHQIFSLIVSAALCALALGVWFFLSYRKGKHGEGNMTT